MKKVQAKIAADAREIAELRADFAALAAAIDPADDTKVWWNYLGGMIDPTRVARVRAALRKKLPFADDDVAVMLAHTAHIQNGDGGLAIHDPTALLLKHAERVLAGRRAEGAMRDALGAVMANLTAANPSVGRLRAHVSKLLG